MAPQADLDAIKAAIASGEQSVEVGGRTGSVYRSVDELRKARDDIAAELAGAATHQQQRAPRHVCRALHHRPRRLIAMASLATT